MSREINYGSLCTGYDGLGMALRLAGVPIRHRWMAESEPSISEVLKIEHPGVPNVGDIKAAPWHLAPHTDLMSSGDPCQSISIAGRQAGRDDPRFLWPWVRQAYRAVRPGGIFFENVANIVSHDGGRTLAERFAHLREDGYAVRWTVLGACAVGSPHHRHRWYAVAAHVGAGAPEAMRVGGDKPICGAPRSGGRVLLPSPTASDRFGAGRTPAREGGDDLHTAVSLLPTPVARDADGRGEGSPEYWSERQQVKGKPLGAEVALLPTPRASDGPNGGPNQRNGRGEHDALPGLVVNGLPGVWGKYADAVTLWEQVTGIPAPEPTEVSPKGSRRLNPALPEWMMGLRPGMLTERLGRSDALKAAGNGVVPLAAAAAWKLLTA